MKFDFIIGNPPYQDETIGDNATYAPPIYHQFMDSSYEIGDAVLLIHPARFLFNAGSTPKAWNTKMLNDTHFKVLYYEADVTKLFPNTNINGGVVISYHDFREKYGAIETFTSFPELNSILHKVKSSNTKNWMSECVISRTAYRLNDLMHQEHPEALSQLSEGHPYDMSTNIFERLPQIFNANKPTDGKDYIQILGRENGVRVTKWVKRSYVSAPKNLNKFKVLMSSADGASGTVGKPIPARITGTPSIGIPGMGNTESFISIGSYETEEIANHALKYVKSKFARALLGVLKITQHITPEKWIYVPSQNFTMKSDIDWSKPVSEIDQQLYAKYGLDANEIAFIESHVKEMD